MSKYTVKGTVQIRVIADPQDTEEVANRISDGLQSAHFQVIERSDDFIDRFDPSRRKFHITAIPKERK